MTEAQRFVAEQLQKMLKDGSRFRVGALLLTYDNGDPNGCQVAHGAGIQAAVAIERSAVDLVQLIKALRHLADQLEAPLKSAPGKAAR